MRKVLLTFLILLLSFAVISCSTTDSQTNGGVVAPSLKNDFYEAVNYELLSSWTIPADKSAISHFSNMDDIVSDRLNELIEQAVSSNPGKEQNKDEYNIKALYETAMDWEKRNVSGFGQFQSYLDKIDAAATITDLLKLNIEMNRKYGVAPHFMQFLCSLI